jgi:hypothetical protein
MPCGCKKGPQQAAGARSARPRKLSRVSTSTSRTGYNPKTYVVIPIDDSGDEDGEVVGERYPTLAEAQKRIRDLGAGWTIDVRSAL